jgi:hypothetical protein
MVYSMIYTFREIVKARLFCDQFGPQRI